MFNGLAILTVLDLQGQVTDLNLAPTGTSLVFSIRATSAKEASCFCGRTFYLRSAGNT